MKKGTLKMAGSKGIKIAGIMVFTYEGAVDAYKTALEVAHTGDFSIEDSCFLSDVEDEMNKIGFSYDELEEIEIGFLKAM